MSFWNNLGLNKKIAIFIIVLLINISALGIMFVSATQSMEKDINNSIALTAISNLLLEREIDHLKWSSTLQGFAYDPTITELKVQEDPAKCAFGQWYNGESRAKAERDFPSIAEALARIAAPHAALHQTATLIKEHKAAGNLDKAIEVYTKDSVTYLAAVQSALRSVIAEIDTLKHQNATQFAAQIQSSRFSTYIMIGVAFFVSLALGLLISKSIASPIVALAQFANKIAQGELAACIFMERKDEIGTLADSLCAIPKTLISVTTAYHDLEESVEKGNMGEVLSAQGFTGDYAKLINGTNSIMGRFRMVLESLPSPVIMLDEQFKITYLNAEGQKFVGEEYKGKSTSNLFGFENAGAIEASIQRSMLEGKPAYGECVSRLNGKTIHFNYTAAPFTRADGKLTSVLQLLTDLTSIKETQQIIVSVATEAQQVADNVASASERLSVQIEQVNNGTNVQRDHAASTATAMEEMNATVLEVARSAAQASEQAESTRVKAAEGAELVNQAVVAIRDINSAANEMGQNMAKLGVQANDIGNVMSIISDIADQTNLLALNAAIEAARAGEAGRGFAVVADEVRKLAEKTMGATTDVGSSIQDIQRGTTIAIKQAETTAENIGRATSIVTASGEALGEIVSFANTTSSLITSIATAAEEQSATSEEINRSVEDINRVTGETSSEMSEASYSVQLLADMAQKLKETLDGLKNQR